MPADGLVAEGLADHQAEMRGLAGGWPMQPAEEPVVVGGEIYGLLRARKAPGPGTDLG